MSVRWGAGWGRRPARATSPREGGRAFTCRAIVVCAGTAVATVHFDGPNHLAPWSGFAIFCAYAAVATAAAAVTWYVATPEPLTAKSSGHSQVSLKPCRA